MHGASCVDNSFSIKLMEKWCLYWVSLTSLRLSEISFRFTDSGQALTLGVWHLHIQEKCALPQAGPLFYHHCPKALDEETTFRQVQSTAVLAGGEETADDFSTVFVPLSLGGVATCSVVKIGLDVWRPCLASTKKKESIDLSSIVSFEDHYSILNILKFWHLWALMKPASSLMSQDLDCTFSFDEPLFSDLQLATQAPGLKMGSKISTSDHLRPGIWDQPGNVVKPHLH